MGLAAEIGQVFQQLINGAGVRIYAFPADGVSIAVTSGAAKTWTDANNAIIAANADIVATPGMAVGSRVRLAWICGNAAAAAVNYFTRWGDAAAGGVILVTEWLHVAINAEIAAGPLNAIMLPYSPTHTVAAGTNVCAGDMTVAGAQAISLTCGLATGFGT